MKLKLTASAIALALSFSATSAELKTFTAGEAAVAADVNANFTAISMDAAAAQTAADAAAEKATTANNAAMAAQTAADAADAAAEANATAIETNTDAIAANSATVNANTAAVQANTDAMAAMAMGKVEWQMVNESGEVVGTVLAKSGDLMSVELSGDSAGLVVQAIMGLSEITGWNTYVDAENRIAMSHEDGEYLGLSYRSEDCTGDAFMKVAWTDSNGAYYNPAEQQWSVGGDRILTNSVNGEFYSVALDSEVIAKADAPTELMSKMNSSGTCSTSTHNAYYDYVQAAPEGELTGVIGSGMAPGKFGMEMPNMMAYEMLDVGAYTISRK
ncbi:hypothetical protein RI844_05200 [Thalassotalea fonticola]|uniref:Uncharacterized protein n=1 Tax=Thalassotalea fonticola TaxID=3065649 RepID=A0ABZ0GT64_9GAMM|nr:hypothetical protein RI844_05200 [Colwelliaceae bacterium S1-1]